MTKTDMVFWLLHHQLSETFMLPSKECLIEIPLRMKEVIAMTIQRSLRRGRFLSFATLCNPWMVAVAQNSMNSRFNIVNHFI